MPGRDYTRAYVLLEQSLHPADSLGSLEGSLDLDQPRSWVPAQSSRAISTSVTTIKVEGSDLPPTPPLNEQAVNSTAGPILGDMNLQKASISSFSTPTNPISPPTPDNTPPRATERVSQSRLSEDHLSPPLGAHSPASYPESYTTAIEDHNISPPNFGLDDAFEEDNDKMQGDILTRAAEWRDATPRAELAKREFKSETYQLDYTEDVPRRSTLKHEMDISDLYEAAIREKSGVVKGGENSTKFRNSLGSSVDDGQQHTTHFKGDRDSIPILMRGLSLRGTQPTHKNPEASDWAFESEEAIPEIEEVTPHELEDRIPGWTVTTGPEATLASSESQQYIAGAKEFLTQGPESVANESFAERDNEDNDEEMYESPSPASASRMYTDEFDRARDSGTSGSSTVVEAVVIDSPPTQKRKLRHASKNASLRDEASNSSDSNRNSINSNNDSPIHRLVRKQNPIPDRRGRGSLDSDVSPSLGSHSLRRRKDTIPGRPHTAPFESEAFPSRFSGVEPTSDLHSLLPPQYFERRTVSDPPRSKAPLATAAKQATVSFRNSSGILDLSDSDGDVPIGFIPEEFHNTPKSFNDRDRRRTRDISTETYQALRKSTDQSILSSENMSRPSLLESQLDSTSYLPRASPGSLEALEVNQATAISIFPHNNNSLLVVQQAANGQDSVVQMRTLPPLTIRAQDDGNINIIPATPIIKDEYGTVDSPMQNPRVPPEPPTLAVIPPTPARELDEQDARTKATGSPNQKPIRGDSFMQKARRYSDVVVGTLVGSGGGNFRRGTSRSHHSRTGQGFASAIRSPSVSEPSQRDGNLHPFWQPRTFWNDLSDSEHEYSDDEEEEEVGDEDEDDRLPAGGDTRELGAEVDVPKWRRGGSLRGFLIGNSLGLERGPTNRRRHVVTIPRQVSVRDSARRSGNGRSHRRRDSSTWVHTLRQRIKDQSIKREEKRREKRRRALAESIGPYYYVEPSTNQRLSA